jgi:hypothetical protein
MDTLEFYIRHASETDARGPYNLEQLVSLAETGSVTVETLYYDATTESWAVIGDNPAVKAGIFPEKKKLTIKAKETLGSINKPKADNLAPITVDDMLAAAEGLSDDTKHKRSGEIAASRAAAIGMWAIVVMFVLSSAGGMLPAIDVLMSLDPIKITTNPLAVIGVIDLIFAVFIGLGMVNLYPMVRFRAALGLGFFGLIFFIQGLHAPMLAAIAGSVSLYLCTIFISLLPVIISAGVGITALAYFALHLSSN